LLSITPGDNKIPVAVIEVDRVTLLLYSSQKISVAVHRAGRIHVIGQVIGLNDQKCTQGPFQC
jgi:hypothetical protein